MDRLSDDVISQLFTQFMAALVDDKKQEVIDELGLHPLNHARFAEKIGRLHQEGNPVHSYLWRDYLDCTKFL